MATTTPIIRTETPMVAVDTLTKETITNEQIAKLSRGQMLRFIEEQNIYKGGCQVSVLSLEMGAELFGSGILGQIDELITKVVKAYAEKGATIEHSYGSLKVSIWAEDTTLRSQIKYYVEQAREKAAVDAEMNEH